MAKLSLLKQIPWRGFLIKPMAMLFPMWVRQDSGIGGASGNGAVYERNTLMGMASAVASIDFGRRKQIAMFHFWDRSYMERFKSSQLSLLLCFGSSCNSRIVRICRRCYGIYDAKGGPMYEASVGGNNLSLVNCMSWYFWILYFAISENWLNLLKA
jgi:hypothetical protein